jgi:hypothetical protein
MSVFDVIRHLLPRARAWTVTVDKQLRQFIQGLAAGLESDGVFVGPKDFVDNVYLDLFPDTTRYLSDWESQFGITYTENLTEAQRRSRLAGVWSETGGQSPSYIQNALQARGFDVYVHDWWQMLDMSDVGVMGDGSEMGDGTMMGVEISTLEPRDPNDVLTDNTKLLTNRLQIILPNQVMVGRVGNRVGVSGIEVGAINGSLAVEQYVDIPTDSDYWYYMMYIGGENYGDVAQIPAERQKEFEEAVLKLRPTQLWVGLIVEYI